MTGAIGQARGTPGGERQSASGLPAPSQHLADIHRFQGGEEAFVWGLDAETGAPWLLMDGSANEHRSYVRSSIVCPVPGCSAALTTVARSRGRDGLKHIAHSGGHSRESIDHANGCAAIESWLRLKYPKSTVNREEYSDPTGERRADIMITSPSGARIAFEVQYSALTPDAWKARHASYRSQGIVDVWLWGHRGPQMHRGSSGHISLTPAQEALVAEDLPLLFINPEQQTVAIGTTLLIIPPHGDGGPRPAVRGWSDTRRTELWIDRLVDYGVRYPAGITSVPLAEFRRNTIQAREAHLAAAEARRQREEEHRRLAAARLIEHRAQREPLARAIVEAFATVDRWNRSEAHRLIAEYMKGHALRPVDVYASGDGRGPWFMRWQAIIYFDLVVGRTGEITTRSAYDQVIARGANMGQPDAFTLIARYLHQLEDDGYLTYVRSIGRYPVFKPTLNGCWR